MSLTLLVVDEHEAKIARCLVAIGRLWAGLEAYCEPSRWARVAVEAVHRRPKAHSLDGCLDWSLFRSR